MDEPRDEHPNRQSGTLSGTPSHPKESQWSWCCRKTRDKRDGKSRQKKGQPRLVRIHLQKGSCVQLVHIVNIVTKDWTVTTRHSYVSRCIACGGLDDGWLWDGCVSRACGVWIYARRCIVFMERSVTAFGQPTPVMTAVLVDSTR